MSDDEVIISKTIVKEKWDQAADSLYKEHWVESVEYCADMIRVHTDKGVLEILETELRTWTNSSLDSLRKAYYSLGRDKRFLILDEVFIELCDIARGPHNFNCSFCGASRDSVELLIGSRLSICKFCAQYAADLFDE